MLFESGPRLAQSLADLAAGLGDREAAVCRELTKLHEEFRRGALSALAQDYAAGAETRGEIVIVIAPPQQRDAALAAVELDAMIEAALSYQSVKDAASEIANVTGLPRRDIYQRALQLAKEK